MALLFEIRLTSPQIEVLRAFSMWDAKAIESPFGNFSHFIVHIKPLLREGLIFHHPEKGKKSNGQDDPKQLHVRWGITEKGRLLLQVIDIELADSRAGRKIQGHKGAQHAYRDKSLAAGAKA